MRGIGTGLSPRDPRDRGQVQAVRHSIEVYVLARKVSGLERGLYHYNPDTHQLAPVGHRGPRRISEYLPGQSWYDEAGALLIMTAIFERVQWRYPYARAYRAVLAEAGHLCQTFCLLATELGLAPFCTMALADSRIERDLKIDGVSESVIYVAGAGSRPDGVEWAPWPGRDDTPVVVAPTHANGLRGARRPGDEVPRSSQRIRR
jgi:SagB-type dehydrogenase family enzyme